MKKATLQQLLAITIALLSSGCALFTRVQANSLAQAADPPSNVAVYVSVTHDGEGVSTLRPRDFRLYEDDKPLDSDTVKLTLLDRNQAAVHRTVVLLDISGEMSSGEQDKLSREVATLVKRIRQTQAVSVYGYSGAENLQRLGEFDRNALMEMETVSEDGKKEEEAPALADFTVADTSTNLYGALTMGNRQLDEQLSKETKPVRVGTVIVIARGPDLAGRVSEEDLAHMMDETKNQQIAITIGTWPDDHGTDLLGTTHLLQSSTLWEVSDAFKQAADLVDDLYDRYYLLAYCSPARAGTRELRVEVSVPSDDGKETVGTLETQFSADGFTASCNPETPPRLVVAAEQQRPDPQGSPPEIVDPTPRPAPEAESDTKPKPAPAPRRRVAPRAAPAPAPAPASPPAAAEPDPAPAPTPAEDGAIAPPPSRPGYE